MDNSLTRIVVPRALWGWIAFLGTETLTQIVFKIAGSNLDGARGIWPLLMQIAASPWAIGGFVLYFAGFLLWMTILRDADLGRAFPITATIYLMSLAAAVFVFHESLNPLRIAGVVTIVAGVALLAGDHDTNRQETAMGLSGGKNPIG